MIELDLSALWTRLIRGWVTPVVIAVIAALFALSSLPGSKPTYSIHMLVMPAPADQNSGSSSGGTLSVLFGLSGGSGGGSNYTRYQSLMFSNAVAQRMIDRHDMLHYVFRDIWDAKNKKWIQSYTLRDELTDWMLRLANIPIWAPPDATVLARILKSKIVIIPSTTTDILDVSMDDGDVAYATHILLAANEEANNVLREQVASRAGQQVAYLQRKLAQTTVEDYRQALLQLLSSEEKTLMLTQTDASYAAEIISPPMASPYPVGPRPVLSLFVALLVGALVGTGIVVFFGPDWWRTLIVWAQECFRGRFGGRALAARR